MSGIESIAAERQRQMDAEGWTPEHDDTHNGGELIRAAACYTIQAVMDDVENPDMIDRLKRSIWLIWSWDDRWWKPKNRRADLVRAGALIAAEIDRLDRANGDHS